MEQKKKPKGITFYSDMTEAILSLSDQAAGQLFKASMMYFDREEILQITDPVTNVLFSVIKSRIAEDIFKYNDRCEKNRENGNRGGAPVGNDNASKNRKQPKQPIGCNSTETTERLQNNPTEQNKTEQNKTEQNRAEDKVKRTRFTAPTLEEVKLYCEERASEGHRKVDADLFFSHYTANGWKQSNGNSIKDWKACVQTWERNNYPSSSGSLFSQSPTSQTKTSADRRSAGVQAFDASAYEGKF